MRCSSCYTTFLVTLRASLGSQASANPSTKPNHCTGRHPISHVVASHQTTSLLHCQHKKKYGAVYCCGPTHRTTHDHARSGIASRQMPRCPNLAFPPIRHHERRANPFFFLLSNFPVSRWARNPAILAQTLSSAFLIPHHQNTSLSSAACHRHWYLARSALILPRHASSAPHHVWQDNATSRTINYHYY